VIAHVRNRDTAFLAPRHLIAVLPVWAALIGTGTVALARAWRRDPRLPALAAVLVAALAVGAQATARDPRTTYRFFAATGDASSTRGIGRWLGRRTEPGDLLFPYAVPFLRALPQARRARSLPRGDARTLLATIGDPGAVPTLWITLPIGPRDRLKPDEIRALRHSYAVAVFPNWLVVR